MEHQPYGQLPKEDLCRRKERLDVIEMTPATATLGPRIELLGRGVVLVPVVGLDQLAAVVREALADLVGEWDHPFTGHLTIGRTRRRARPRLLGRTIEASFPVEAFRYTAGEPGIYRTSAHGHRELCTVCGTQIAYRESQGASTVDVNVGSLDDPDACPPTRHIWWADRPAVVVCERLRLIGAPANEAFRA